MRNKMTGAKLLIYAVLASAFGGFAAIWIFFGFTTAVGIISGIISILMFLIYVVGRMWLISHGRTAFRDKIYVMRCSDGDFGSMSDDMYVVDEIDCQEGGYGNSYIVTSVDGIYDLCVNHLEYDEELSKVIKKTKVLDIIPFVNPGHSVSIRAYTPDLVARYEVEFYTYDYKRVRALLFTSGRDGSFAGGIDVEPGWRSFWYQFLN